MTTSFQALQGLHYRLTERIPSADVEGVFERELRRRSESGESLAQVRARLGDEVWAQALQTARDIAYESALKDSGLRPVSDAEFSWVQREHGADCVFTATFEVLPSIDLGKLDEIEIPAPDTQIGQADVNHAIEVLRDEHKSFTPVARASQQGDRVVFDFEGTLAGEAFDGSAKTNAAAVLGAGDVLEEMEIALIGRRADEAFDTPITFPQDYAKAGLRGETAMFSIRVHSVAAPALPEVGPEFVKRLGIESGSLDELRAQLRGNLEAECKRTKARYQRQQLTDALLAAIPVAVPETLLAHEIERLRATFENDSNDSADTAESAADLPEQPLKATAQRRVKLSLIVSEIIRERNIRLDAKRVEKKLDDLAARFALADVDRTKRQYRENKQTMHNVQALVIEEQGFESALKTVRKNPVAMSFDDLMQATEAQT